MLIALTLSMVPPVQEAPAPVGEIRLICSGSANANTTMQSHTGAVDNWGNAVSAVTTADATDSRVGEAELVVSPEGGRAHLPRQLMPLFGAKGWSKLKNVKFSDDEITATAATHLIKGTAIRVNRRSGFITMTNPAGTFEGQCRKASDEPQRF